jgi:hypothetical protein
MTTQVEVREKLETELFNSNEFKEMFELAAHRQLVIQENTLLMGQFFSLLNLEALKELAKKEQVGQFLDALIPFLEKNQNFTRIEKKKFLNGCENILFLHAVMLGKKEYVEYLNTFRVDKSLHVNRNFLANRITEQNYSAIELLLEHSENVTYESSKVIKTLYVSLCRDYELFKRLIAKHGFDINGYGEMGLSENFKGSFLHALALMADSESNKFFADFIKDYGSQIDFNLNFTDSVRGLEINILDVIINNDKLDSSEKMTRINAMLTYGSLSEEHLAHLSKILINDKIISRYHSDTIYDALFAHQNFNSPTFDRENVLNKILELDNSEEFAYLRRASNYTVNPTTIMLEKFYRFSSPIQITKEHPFALWIKSNENNEKFSVDTLASLLKHYKQELNEIGLGNLKMPVKMAQMLMQIGLDINKKGIMAKMFPKENNVKDRTLTNSANKKVEPIILPSKQATETNSGAFNKALFLKVTDSEVSKYIDAIVVQANQILVIAGDKSQEQQYVKVNLPKLVNTTVENYLKFLNDNPEQAKKNAVIQLKMLHKKTFELLSNILERH